MTWLWTPAALLLLLAASCPTSSSGVEQKVDLDRSFDLAVGQSAEVAEAGFTLRFDRVAGDNRCPVDVVCITAGDAVAVLTATGGGTTTHELHEVEGPRTAQRGAFEIQLERLLPAPLSTRRIAPDEYVARLRVVRK